MFFTSGTTGEPKGVVTPHGAIARLFQRNSFAPFTSDTVMPLAAPVPWDAFAMELWSVLLNGGRSLIVDEPFLTATVLRAAVADAIVAPVGRRWPKVNGFFWMQGERDGETPEASAAYETNLRNLITRVRADFGDDKLPMVLGRVRLSEPFATTVRAAQDAAAHRMAKVKTLNTDRLVLAADGVHYDTGAIETLGRQMADAYLTLS